MNESLFIINRRGFLLGIGVFTRNGFAAIDIAPKCGTREFRRS